MTIMQDKSEVISMLKDAVHFQRRLSHKTYPLVIGFSSCDKLCLTVLHTRDFMVRNALSKILLRNEGQLYAHFW